MPHAHESQFSDWAEPFPGASYLRQTLENTQKNDFALRYGIFGIPEMWLINQRGEVVSTDLSVEQLDQRIEQLMSSGDHLSRK